VNFDLITAFRALGRARGHAAAVVFTLALGLGSATAIFSLVETSLFPASSVPDPASLVRISLSDPKTQRAQTPRSAHYWSYREAAPPSFAEFSALASLDGNLVHDGQVRPVNAARVTTDYFHTLGVNAARGRLFLPEDGVAAGVQPAVLSDAFWRMEFGADPGIIGRVFTYDGQSCVVVGVLPRGFRLVGLDWPKLYLPTGPNDFAPTAPGATQGIILFARLKPGATRAAAEAELRTLRPGAGLPAAKAWENLAPVVRAHDADAATPGNNPLLRRKDWAMLGAVGFLHLIACVNAANLMLVRTMERRLELGVRLALGASRWRVLRPVLLEGALLALASVLAALAVAKWLFAVLLALSDAGPAAGDTLYLSTRALQLLAGLGFLTGLVLVLFPLWQAGRLDVHAALKIGGQSGAGFARSAVRDAFVVIQAALAIVLLISTGLMIRTCRQLLAFDGGFATQGRYLVSVYSRGSPVSRNAQALAARSRVLTESVRAVPGVRAVSLFIGTIEGGSGAIQFRVEGSDIKQVVRCSAASADYFTALGLPVIVGRGFDGLNPGQAPVAVLSESLARQLFGEANPLGRRLVFDKDNNWEVIGVVRDVRLPRQDGTPLFYVPLWQGPRPPSSILIQTEGDTGPQFEGLIRRALYDADPTLQVQRVQRLEDAVNEYARNERSALAHLRILGALALALAGFGLFAMMSYNVTRRAAEFGVRYALGADDTDIRGLVLGRGLRLVALGLVAGTVLAWLLARAFSTLLYKTPAFDPLVTASVVAIMLGLALLACWLPVRRATRVDLARLLRAE